MFFMGLEHADGDQFAYELDGLAMVRGVSQGVVCLAEQFGDKIGDFVRFLAVGECQITASESSLSHVYGSVW